MTELEVTVEREEHAWNVTRGREERAVRVRWREKGARRWNSFLLVAEPGQTLDELEEYSTDAAYHVATGQVAW